MNLHEYYTLLYSRPKYVSKLSFMRQLESNATEQKQNINIHKIYYLDNLK